MDGSSLYGSYVKRNGLIFSFIDDFFPGMVKNICWQKLKSYFCQTQKTVVLAQLVRAPDCGSGGRGFEPHIPPIVLKAALKRAAFFI